MKLIVGKGRSQRIRRRRDVANNKGKCASWEEWRGEERRKVCEKEKCGNGVRKKEEGDMGRESQVSCFPTLELCYIIYRTK